VIFHSGCTEKDYEIIKDQKQVFFVFETDEETGRRYLNEEKSTCVSRQYKYSLKYVGKIGSPKHIPFDECQKVIGYTPSDYVEVHEYHEKVREAIEDEVDKHKKREGIDE
jgi:hypothetical protein